MENFSISIVNYNKYHKIQNTHNANISMKKLFLTTTEAATMLFVAPDTVLKWVKAGKIKSYRAPGGHSRIPLESVTALLAEQNGDDFWLEPKSHKSYQYCWQQLDPDSKIKDDCKKCLNYIYRTERCYKLRKSSDGIGCIRIGCDMSCEECDYYKLVCDQVLNVLIMSESRKTLSDRPKPNFIQDMKIEFVADEYECSYIIEKFRADYFMIDLALGLKRIWTFCRHLYNDPRIPFARIILTSENMYINNFCDKEIFGWIKKPLSVENIKEYIHRVSAMKENV